MEKRTGMIKNFNIYIKENIEDVWIKCPSDYEFENGEEVKMSSNSNFQHQCGGDKTGFIKSKNVRDNAWYVKWKEGRNDCYYWRGDLLIKLRTPEEIEKIRKRKEEIRLKHMEIDPFGEEEWLEEGVSNDKYKDIVFSTSTPLRSINNSEKQLKNALVGSIVKFKTYVDKNSPTKGPFDAGYQEWIIDRIKDAYEDYEGRIVVTTESDEKYYLFFTPNCIYIHNPEKEERLRILKDKMRDIDPYGEEDWLEESVSSNDNFEIGDRVIYIDTRKGPGQRSMTKGPLYGTVIRKNKGNYGVEFDEHINGHDCVYGESGEGGKMGYCWNVEPHQIKLIDDSEYQKKRKEREAKREEIRLKRLDVDPFGEEEWLDESVSNGKSYKIIKRLPYNEREALTFKDLNRDYTGWVIIDTSVYRDYVIHIKEWKSNSIFTYDSFFSKDNPNLRTGIFEFILNDYYNIIFVDIKESKKIRRPDIDPFDEEEWGYEDIKENKKYDCGGFEVGDRVIWTGKGYPGTNGIGIRDKLKGKKLLGTVVVLWNKWDEVGVEFDLNIGGHDCGGGLGRPGRGKDGHCWNVTSKDIKLIGDEDFLLKRERDLEIKRKEREREKQELRDKMKDVDPFGEEDWEND